MGRPIGAKTGGGRGGGVRLFGPPRESPGGGWPPRVLTCSGSRIAPRLWTPARRRSALCGSSVRASSWASVTEVCSAARVRCRRRTVARRTPGPPRAARATGSGRRPGTASSADGVSQSASTAGQPAHAARARRDRRGPDPRRAPSQLAGPRRRPCRLRALARLGRAFVRTAGVPDPGGERGRNGRRAGLRHRIWAPRHWADPPSPATDFGPAHWLVPMPLPLDQRYGAADMARVAAAVRAVSRPAGDR